MGFSAKKITVVSYQNYRNFLARPEGFEPPAFRIGICCDIQLRHGRTYDNR